MKFSNVYYLSNQEISSLYQSMAEHFYDDELYRTAFPDGKSRKRAVRYLFKHYLKAIRPCCHFIADSGELNSVMVVFDSTLEVVWKYRLRFWWLNMKMIPLLLSLLSFESVKHIVKCWDMFTSSWVKAFVVKDEYHVDLLYTEINSRHQGLAQHLLLAVCEAAKRDHMDVSVETHHEANVALYEKVGFKLMVEITHPEYTLKQYCLLIRNEEDSI